MKFAFAIVLVMMILKLINFRLSRGEDIYTEVSFDGGEDVGKHFKPNSYIISDVGDIIVRWILSL